MPAVETLQTIKANILLNNGTTQTGSIRTVNQSIGTLEPSRWDVDKAFEIVMAATPIFTRPVVEAQNVKTYRITQGS